MDKLLKKMEAFTWSEAYQAALNKLKEKLVSTHIIVYPYWNKTFHVHIRCIRDRVRSIIGAAGREKYGSPSVLFHNEIINSTMKLYNNRERSIGHGLLSKKNSGITCWERHSNSSQTTQC